MSTQSSTIQHPLLYRFLLPLVWFVLIATTSAQQPNPLDDIMIRKPWWERAKQPMHPQIEKALQDLVERLAPLQRKNLSTHMTSTIATLAKKTGLQDESKKKALADAANLAVDQSMKPYKPSATNSFRFVITENENEIDQEDIADIAVMLKEIPDDEINLFLQVPILGCKLPQEQPLWTDALKENLSTEQLEIWNKHTSALRDTKAKQISKLLDPWEEAGREQAKETMQELITKITKTIKLDDTRLEKLTQGSTQAINNICKEERARAEEGLNSMIKPSKSEIFDASLEADLQNSQHWIDLLQAVLTPEEIKAFKSAKDDRKSRRIESIGMLLVAELDKRVAFTIIQRKKLLPIAERVVETQSQFFIPNKPNRSRYTKLQLFYDAAKKVKAAELKPILDAMQIANWNKALADGPPPNNHHFMRPVAAPQKAKHNKPQRKPEPEAVDHAITNYLYKKTIKERNKVLPLMLLKAEDAGRVANLSDASIKRLETAARGASEKLINRNKANWTSNLTSQIQGATPENIERKLASLQNHYYYGVRSPTADEQNLWKKAVKAEMTEAQQIAWKKETDQRLTFYNEALTAFAMTEFDGQYTINQTQWDKLKPVVSNIVTNYKEDIELYMSNEWYLRGYSTLIPFVGVPEKDMKSILSKKQWDNWRGNHAWNYWPQVERYHKQRSNR